MGDPSEKLWGEIGRFVAQKAKENLESQLDAITLKGGRPATPEEIAAYEIAMRPRFIPGWH